jgi:two-component system response regulator YesN
MQTVLHERQQNFSMLGYGEGEVWPRLLSFETAWDAQLWLGELARAINRRFAEQTGKQKRQAVDSVKAYIREQFSRDISVDEIAEALHYSSDYLNLLFKQATGESIHGWLCQHKIELAKQMLKDTRLKLYEITDRLGFSHAAYFNSFFKKYTGLTPKEYREGEHEVP